MGEFDDVLAMEPGDDWAAWDEWAAGEGVAAPVELAPLVAELRMPQVQVHLRGAVPADVIDTFADLADSRLEVRDGSPLVTLTFDDLDDGATSIVDLERGEVGRGTDVRSLTTSLAEVLCATSEQSDPHHLHMAGALVEVHDRDAEDARSPGIGVVLVEPNRAARHAVTAAVVRDGARLASADRVIVLPGSRTVAAEPLPLELDTGWTRASAIGSVTPCATIGAVVFCERRSGAAASIERLSTASGCARWLQETGGLDQFGPVALDVLAPLAAAASFWTLVHDDDTAASRLIGDLVAPDAQELATICRLDGSTGRDGRRLARFESAAVLVDGGTGRVEVVDDDGARALEASSAVSTAAATDLWGLPDTPRGDATVPLSPVGSSADATSITAVLAEVIDLLTELDSEPVVLGDLVLAHDGPLPAGAVAFDRVDLLVDRDAVKLAADPLESAGYLVAPQSLDVHEGGSSVEFRAPVGAVTVGLHWQLAVGPFGELVDHDELLRRSVPVRIEDRWCRALHPEDRFVLACVRVATSDPVTTDQLRAVVLSAPRDDRLLASALEASERWGATRTVTHAVRVTDAALPGLSPWLVARSRPGASGTGAEDGGRQRRRFGAGRRKRR